MGDSAVRARVGRKQAVVVATMSVLAFLFPAAPSVAPGAPEKIEGHAVDRLAEDRPNQAFTRGKVQASSVLPLTVLRMASSTCMVGKYVLAS